MSIDLSTIPMSARRAIEAELAQRIYAAALPRLGHDEALELLNAAIYEAARDAGKDYATKAPGGVPSLQHFAKVLDLWQAGGALSITDITLTPESLVFCVTRCGYMDMYREMGLPQPLHSTLSCGRDTAFSEGYSPHLRMERPQAISEGAQSCLFRFRWVT